MTDATTLASRSCEACEKGTPPMEAATAREMLGQLDGWSLTDDGKAITKRWEFKGFLKAQAVATLAAAIADRQGHHPDIRFGWGYAEIDFTTHAAGGLTENDFICAARIDAALA